MSEESLVKEIKMHNEQIFKAFKEDKKKKEWQNNPVLYIIAMTVISLILNFLQGITKNDLEILQLSLKNHAIQNESSFMNINKKIDDNINCINLLKKDVNSIKTDIEIFKDRDKSDWEKAVEKYNKDKRTRGVSMNKDTLSYIYSEIGYNHYNYQWYYMVPYSIRMFY